jgi:hypothetical protein
VIARLDINAVLERVDLDALVERTELGSLIARSSSAVMAQIVDTSRSHGVTLDAFVHRWADRFMRRNATTGPGGPALLVQPQAPV